MLVQGQHECFTVHIQFLYFRNMNQPANIIIIDQGTPIPRYLLSMITELLKSLVVTTEALAPQDCSGS